MKASFKKNLQDLAEFLNWNLFTCGVAVHEKKEKRGRKTQRK